SIVARRRQWRSTASSSARHGWTRGGYRRFRMDKLKRLNKAGETVVEVVSTVEDWLATFAETIEPPIVRRIPDLARPQALQPPGARDIVASTFNFWEGLAKAQKEFTLRVLDAFDPAAHRAKNARHPKARVTGPYWPGGPPSGQFFVWRRRL